MKWVLQVPRVLMVTRVQRDRWGGMVALGTEDPSVPWEVLEGADPRVFVGLQGRKGPLASRVLWGKSLECMLVVSDAFAHLVLRKPLTILSHTVWLDPREAQDRQDGQELQAGWAKQEVEGSAARPWSAWLARRGREEAWAFR